MLRTPVLTTVALLSLGLGIGANTAIFSFMDTIMLRSLPVKDPSQLVLLGTGRDSGISDDPVFTDLYSYPFFRQMQQRNSIFSSTAAVFSITNRVYGFLDHRDTAEPMYVKLVSGSYFPTLGSNLSSAAPSTRLTTPAKAITQLSFSVTLTGSAPSRATPTFSIARSSSVTPPTPSSASLRPISSEPRSEKPLTCGRRSL